MIIIFALITSLLSTEIVYSVLMPDGLNQFLDDKDMLTETKSKQSYHRTLEDAVKQTMVEAVSDKVNEGNLEDKNFKLENSENFNLQEHKSAIEKNFNERSFILLEQKFKVPFMPRNPQAPLQSYFMNGDMPGYPVFHKYSRKFPLNRQNSQAYSPIVKEETEGYRYPQLSIRYNEEAYAYEPTSISVQQKSITYPPTKEKLHQDAFVYQILSRKDQPPYKFTLPLVKDVPQSQIINANKIPVQQDLLKYSVKPSPASSLTGQQSPQRYSVPIVTENREVNTFLPPIFKSQQDASRLNSLFDQNLATTYKNSQGNGQSFYKPSSVMFVAESDNLEKKVQEANRVIDYQYHNTKLKDDVIALKQPPKSGSDRFAFVEIPPRNVLPVDLQTSDRDFKLISVDKTNTNDGAKLENNNFNISNKPDNVSMVFHDSLLNVNFPVYKNHESSNVLDLNKFQNQNVDRNFRPNSIPSSSDLMDRFMKRDNHEHLENVDRHPKTWNRLGDNKDCIYPACDLKKDNRMVMENSTHICICIGKPQIYFSNELGDSEDLCDCLDLSDED